MLISLHLRLKDTRMPSLKKMVTGGTFNDPDQFSIHYL